jgi:hypothetical protein
LPAYDILPGIPVRFRVFLQYSMIIKNLDILFSAISKKGKNEEAIER